MTPNTEKETAVFQKYGLHVLRKKREAVSVKRAVFVFR